MTVVETSSFRDVRLSVSCKPVSGHVDQGCDLVWRFKDPDDYDLTRANALEDNVNLYHVVLDARDSTFRDAGKIGVWTKADSVMQFDDLSATPLCSDAAGAAGVPHQRGRAYRSCKLSSIRL